MTENMTNEMEGALRAVIESNGAGGLNIGGGATDLVGLVMKLLPRLLQSTEERGDLVELQREGASELLKEVRTLRKQQRGLVRSHKGVLEELRLMRELQATMVSHLARVQIIEMPDDDEHADDDEYLQQPEYAEDLQAPPSIPRRRPPQGPRTRVRRSQRR